MFFSIIEKMGRIIGQFRVLFSPDDFRLCYFYSQLMYSAQNLQKILYVKDVLSSSHPLIWKVQFEFVMNPVQADSEELLKQ